MGPYQSHQADSTITLKVMSAIVFCILSFFWIYWFQADLLSVAQHALSGGQTRYNRMVGALLITTILMIVQQMVSSFLQLGKHSYALTYLPSMLLLAIVSDIHPDQNNFFTHRLWIVIVPVILSIWGVVVWIIKQLYSYDEKNERRGSLSTQMWINVFEICGMMLGVAWLGNTNAVLHYRAHVETSLMMGKVSEALHTGARSQETDVRLTQLRVYALAKNRTLADHLFDYSLRGRGEQLVPLSGAVRPMLLPKDSIYRQLGARPIAIHTPARYYAVMQKSGRMNKTIADYHLCGLLLDKKIDEFIDALPLYYDLDGPLPRHYREALVLYTHLRNEPIVAYYNATMEEDWKNFQYLRNQYTAFNERKGIMAEYYRGSYWYYFFFE